MIASGVRSSWLTSASRLRRCSSSAWSRAAIVSKPRASSWIGGRSGLGLADPDAVVAVLDPARRGDHPVEVAGGAERAPEQGGDDHDGHARRRSPPGAGRGSRAATRSR